MRVWMLQCVHVYACVHAFVCVRSCMCWVVCCSRGGKCMVYTCTPLPNPLTSTPYCITPYLSPAMYARHLAQTSFCRVSGALRVLVRPRAPVPHTLHTHAHLHLPSVSPVFPSACCVMQTYFPPKSQPEMVPPSPLSTEPSNLTIKPPNKLNPCGKTRRHPAQTIRLNTIHTNCGKWKEPMATSQISSTHGLMTLKPRVAEPKCRS